jgi:hypothetical protein
MDTYTSVRLTCSGVVSNTPCVIGGIHFNGDGTHASDLTIYDGTSTLDPQIFKFYGDKDNSKHVLFQPFLKTERGLYITFGTYVSEVIVQLLMKHE